MSNTANSKVLEAPFVSAEAICALTQNDILAVRVAGYCDTAVCAHAMRKLEGAVGRGYRGEPNFEKFFGGALFDGGDGASDALEDYFKGAAGWDAACKEIFSPYTSPADKLRLDLQEVWPAGSHLARIGGRLAFAGLIRGFREGAEARPHQDMTHWDLPQFPELQTLKTQLSCLTYLSCTEFGGDLELWAKAIEDQTEYENCKIPGDYGLDRNHIGPPDATISPHVGELVIFNARRIHAVCRIDRGLRYSQSFFIGYRADDRPLSIFS
jgi:hypothetical protein